MVAVQVFERPVALVQACTYVLLLLVAVVESLVANIDMYVTVVCPFD
jgi:hypothetical protein